MSSRRSSGGGDGQRAPLRLEEALRQWPSPERTPLAWDELAQATLARLDGGTGAGAGVSDEALMAAPLPERLDEVQSSAPPAAAAASAGGAARPAPEAARDMNDTPSSSRQRDRASLKELARLADTAPPSSRPGASRDPRASRPSYPGPVSSGRFAANEEPVGAEREESSGMIHLGSLTAGAAAAEVAPPVASVGASVTAAAPVSSVQPAAPPAAAPHGASRTRTLAGVGSLIAAAAVAAGVLVGMRHPPAEPAALGAAGPAGVQQVWQGSHAAAPLVATAGATPIAASDQGIDPMSLPPVDTSGPAHLAPSAPRPPSAVAAAASVSPGAAVAAAAASAAPAPKLTAVIPASSAAPDESQSLQALMQQAAGVTPGATSGSPTSPDSPDAPQAAQGSVPRKPSLGALQGALGAALPGARACLGPDDAVSHAMVTFQSDGSVQSVSVSGGAAGKPAEGCIRSALMKARVAPFAQPTFSAPATIRGS